MDVLSNPYSHLTAKERTQLSFPAKVLLERNLLRGTILDYGCGIGKDVELIKEKGLLISGFDPYYFPAENLNKADTILCIYVLNVLQPEEQTDVLMNVSALLNPDGKAYFAVRRDLNYEGFRTHKLHKVKTYQCNVKLPYISIFKNDFCEIYEYQAYTEINVGNTSISPFFDDNEPRELLFESASAFSIYDKFPVSAGHTLIVPKRLISNYFELTTREQFACILMINKVKAFLQKHFNPNGFNIGLNIGNAAGQTVNHCHIHIIPRYSGDVLNPRGGIRGVIPLRKDY